MTKSVKVKPPREKSEDLSRNHEQKIRLRKRLQDDKEREQELREYLDNAGEPIQDQLRGERI